MSEVKYCAECEEYKGHDICFAPENMTKSIVTSLMFPVMTADQLRSDVELCGPSAKWFE